MRNWILKASVLFLSLLMIYSTKGVAVYHHICGCHFAPETSKQACLVNHSDCKSVGMSLAGSCCSGTHFDCCAAENHAGCHTEVTYLKVPIISLLPVEEQEVQASVLPLPDFLLQDRSLKDEVTAGRNFFVPSHTFMPQAGESLVILLHIIKIPFPENLS